MKQHINSMFTDMQTRISSAEEAIKKLVLQAPSFELIAYIFLYNHNQDAAKYVDYREDKHYFVAEALAIECLKSKCIDYKLSEEQSIKSILIELQEKLYTYCSLKGISEIQLEDNSQELNNLSEKYSLIQRSVRNPSLPHHHMHIYEELFEPLEDRIKDTLGFSHYDSITLRLEFMSFLNSKIKSSQIENELLIKKAINEAKLFKRTRKQAESSNFTLEDLVELSRFDDKKLKKTIRNIILQTTRMANVISFTSNEITDFFDITSESSIKLLEKFSINFLDLAPDQEIYPKVSPLESKPIVHHNGRYIIPSIPCFTFSFEKHIENSLKGKGKIWDKYSLRKHDFTLQKGLDLLTKILPTSVLLPINLFYDYDDKKCEVDGILTWDNTIFIIEVKGNLITDKTKFGHKLKFKDQVDDLIKHPHKQALRAANYLRSTKNPVFNTKNGKQYSVAAKSDTDFILLSLTLETIGTLSINFKDDNTLFKGNDFPFTISIFDLMVYADLLESPFSFMHFIKERKKFMKIKEANTFEELDLLGYYLDNPLFVERLIASTPKNIDFNFIQLDNMTDGINNFYMHKFNKTYSFKHKPKIKLNENLIIFLNSIEKESCPGRHNISLFLLSLPSHAHDYIMKMFLKFKKNVSKNKEVYAHSFHITQEDVFGFTYFTSTAKTFRGKTLFEICTKNRITKNAKTWVGIRDIATSRSKFRISELVILNNLDDTRFYL